MLKTRPLLILALLLSTAANAKDGAKAHPVRKIDTTPNHDNSDVWTFTLESNTYAGTDYLNPTLDFSAANGWDLQLASYNIPVYGGGAQNYEWDTYINLSKTFDFGEQYKLVLGSQNGTTAFAPQRHWHNIDYGLLAYQPLPWLSVRAGPFWADKALTTTTDVLAYTAGFNLNFSADFYLQGDYFSGHNNVSGAVVNLCYQAVYAGVGVPETDSGNEFYGVVGFKINLSTLKFGAN